MHLPPAVVRRTARRPRQQPISTSKATPRHEYRPTDRHQRSGTILTDCGCAADGAAAETAAHLGRDRRRFRRRIAAVVDRVRRSGADSSERDLFRGRRQTKPQYLFIDIESAVETGPHCRFVAICGGTEDSLDVTHPSFSLRRSKEKKVGVDDVLCRQSGGGRSAALVTGAKQRRHKRRRCPSAAAAERSAAPEEWSRVTGSTRCAAHSTLRRPPSVRCDRGAGSAFVWPFISDDPQMSPALR